MTQDWPPVYSVRKSVRARKILLKVKPISGLEIIIPEHRKRFNIEHILEENRYWIEKMIKRVCCEKTANPIIDIKNFSPIECRATGENWEVCYKHKPDRKKLHLKVEDVDRILVISGHIENHHIVNHAEYKRLLTRWLMKYAYSYLLSWITELSECTGLVFKHLKIRGQTTLWGSCNAKKVISLNYKLIFLPNALVKHVLLHELCHLQHLNHSKCFWNLLEKWDPEYQAHKKLLKSADAYLPLFLRI